MRNAFFTFALMLLGSILYGQASAQPSIALHGSYGFSDQGDISKGLWGGGAQLRFFLGPHLAVGATAKVFTEDLEITPGTGSIETSSSIIPVSGLLEYYFTEKGIRPYIGTEAGVYFLKLKAGNLKANASNFGVAPKVGLQIPLGKTFGIFAEGAYNIVFGNENSIQVSNPGNVDFNNSSKFFTLQAGIIIGLGSSF
ncbi:outer membrane beta-barrel protein [Dyadobacter sp. CY326]|uniref:outer membrane beta-barrel protein n=1 Tax=Dyadobacter sp. CY326 TaxID=2907300 RepID=UPI001F1647EE|nr:outer membrane beta-barrel protein [Dyadobacter sp. CY326]MCE7065505.1 porin family protein [Dyadobacter sp. CY326]